MKVPPFCAGPAVRRGDWDKQAGAHELACRIMDVWRRAGHPNVYAWGEKAKGHSGEQELWQVKTNLVGGLPPR